MEMSNDEIDHVMESDEGYDHPESIVKAPKKKRTLSPEHLAKMREGRVRYLEAKRILKLSKNSAAVVDEEEPVAQPKSQTQRKVKVSKAPKKRTRTVNNYYYQEPEEEESEEESESEEEIENNYYGGSASDMAGMRFV
jgi:hypothetical protein